MYRLTRWPKLKMENQQKTDERMIVACSDELVAKKRIFTGPAISQQPTESIEGILDELVKHGNCTV